MIGMLVADAVSLAAAVGLGEWENNRGRMGG